ncbi:MAG TPA: MoaD/ThiS family protein [Candidatus Bathyarchaeota archaeon]|nr:MoaD/ThiS family protein [Candidatus Bathyarchaeota archaeon]
MEPSSGSLSGDGMPLKVRVLLLGTFKEASGRGEVELTIPGDRADVATAIEELLKVVGEKLERELIDPLSGTPLPTALILLNGVEINNLEGLETEVIDGDTLTLLPVVHGG